MQSGQCRQIGARVFMCQTHFKMASENWNCSLKNRRYRFLLDLGKELTQPNILRRPRNPISLQLPVNRAIEAMGVFAMGYTAEKTISTTSGQQQSHMDLATLKHTIGAKRELSPRSEIEKFDSFAAGVQQNREVRSGGSIQVNKYVDEPLLSRNSDPLKGWGARKTFHPELCDLAQRALCIVGSSVPGERFFLKAGQIIRDRHNKLAGKKVSQIKFLNSTM
ncbi:hypothetical protein J437_LFUL016250 [Ladona fulva]|uniref:HAT C-terminal dimerisation domain-containing protein n=1 Tax=Ladona fulva TaxID=123851 RepID=A0A8K0PA13_LADFU|nr:hypothetical protein J437_LFUL016250 [Ladona fulva]